MLSLCIFCQNRNKSNMAMHFWNKKAIPFNTRARMPTSQKRFSTFELLFFQTEGFLQRDLCWKIVGNLQGRRGRLRVLDNLKLILSFVFLGFRLDLTQGICIISWQGSGNSMLLGQLDQEYQWRRAWQLCDWERLGCNGGGVTLLFPEQHTVLNFQGLNTFKHFHWVEKTRIFCSAVF